MTTEDYDGAQRRANHYAMAAMILENATYEEVARVAAMYKQ